MVKHVIIVVGTRPNFIKITQFEKEFSKYPGEFKYTLIHTGQHHDTQMSDVFFQELKLKQPDIYLNVNILSAGEQIGETIQKLSKLFLELKPNIVIVAGDVNSTLAAGIAANKCGVRLAHLESGLRSRDWSMPEEINRVLVDKITDEYFVTEDSGIKNLEAEDHIAGNIHFVGNTMIDAIVAFDNDIASSEILTNLKLKRKEYILLTMHRPVNVDSKQKLKYLVEIIDFILQKSKIVFPVHPRTLKMFKEFDLLSEIENKPGLMIVKPLGYLDFQNLISNSKFVVTDSGGIQEETTFRQIPCLTLRENTERPSTLSYGNNKLVPFKVDVIKEEMASIFDDQIKPGQIPPLWDGKATERIVKILRNII